MLSEYENEPVVLSGHRVVEKPRMVYLGRTKSGAAHYRMVEQPKRSVLDRAVPAAIEGLQNMPEPLFWVLVALVFLLVAGVEGGAILG